MPETDEQPAIDNGTDTSEDNADGELTAYADADAKRPNLKITKDVSAQSTYAGQTLQYYINVVYTGPSSALNVMVTDELPIGLLNNEFSVDGGATWSK